MGSRNPIRIRTASIARLVLSLIIAFGIWAFVTNERDPDRTQVYDGLEVQGANTLRSDFQIVDAFPTVTVTVKGPQSVIQGMSSSSVTPSVDLTGITEAGQYEIEVEVDAPSGLRDVEVNPETIVVEVGTVVSRIMELSIVEPPNAPPTLSSISLSTSQVRLIGVQENVESVVRVEVPVALSGRTESFTITERPIPYNENGLPMTELVRIEPQSVQVTVEFEVRGVSVPIIVQCACPTETGGLEIRDLLTAVALPSTVRIEGPEALLNEVSAVRTVPINIEPLEASGFLPNGAELDGSTLPEGVTMERQSVDVYVEIEQAIQTFNQADVTIVNVPGNMEASVTPDTVSFEVQGMDDSILTLADDPPIVIVDVSGLEPGTHLIEPRIVLPPDVRAINVQPSEVQVTIEPVPPTPRPSPTPAPTPTATPTSQPSSLSPQVPDEDSETVPE